MKAAGRIFRSAKLRADEKNSGSPGGPRRAGGPKSRSLLWNFANLFRAPRKNMGIRKTGLRLILDG
jgi:hypothetical protein